VAITRDVKAKIATATAELRPNMVNCLKKSNDVSYSIR
jgi:hypothetical protein